MLRKRAIAAGVVGQVRKDTDDTQTQTQKLREFDYRNVDWNTHCAKVSF